MTEARKCALISSVVEMRLWPGPSFRKSTSTIICTWRIAGCRSLRTRRNTRKNALAAITLHGASRPRNERAAWTVNFQTPLLNVFASSDNPSGTVVANVFSEGVRVGTQSLFYADTMRGNTTPRRSVVDFEGSDFFTAAERYYANSEQRLTRFFPYGDDEYVLVGAQPDCDLAWLEGLDVEAVRKLDTTRNSRCSSSGNTISNAAAPTSG